IREQEQQALQIKIQNSIQESTELEKQVDILINDYLNQEVHGKELIERWKTRQKEVLDLENLCSKLEEEERQQLKYRNELQAIREHKANELSNIKRKFMETVGEAKMIKFFNHELYK